ncbi:MAG: sodium:solute symporter family protein [Sedimentisphaerales bacterium]|nr:sodium:solute symporter family protein [Sedimentisphaerales bacterium]
MLAQSFSILESVLIVLYLLVIAYLGWLGYRRTKNQIDYLIAGRKTHPFVMAMSYGATFISTSAIVGFGGVAGMFGMSLLWLVFLNIFVGIFIAFVFLGEPTRKLGHRLDAHTFPELLGKRYQSKSIQVIAGAIITVFIPLYAAAVLIGGCEFITVQFHVDYNLALLIFSVIVASYVVVGGLKGVMYADAMQGTIMFFSMLILLVWTYISLGGITPAHQALVNMKDQAFAGFQAMGHQGWTNMPSFGWGDNQYNLWWLVVSTIILGVGIGVLAQPQLIVRFMTVKSKKELNRATLIGALFILIIPGSAYIVGSLSNVYFFQEEVIKGQIVGQLHEIDVIAARSRDTEKHLSCDILQIDTAPTDGLADTYIISRGVGPAAEILPQAEITQLDDGTVQVRSHATSYTRVVVPLGNGQWALNTDSIIPTYIRSAMPRWFGILFLLTLLSAAMSTLSSQFHALGTSVSHDVFTPLRRQKIGTIGLTRIGIIIGIILAMLISHYARGGYIIARATAIFFGLCASAFLPAFIGGLFFRRVTKTAVIASISVGFVATLFWLVFIKAKEAEAIGIVQIFSDGKPSLLADYPNWPTVDPILIALPLSILTIIIVSMVTRPPHQEHLDQCFQ